MAVKSKIIPQSPLIFRGHRLMEAFAKSDDERDFYLDRLEGFLVFVDLDKSQEELDELEKELKGNLERYYPIPKLTFYEIKRLMEGFVNEKVYDIDTKEKLLDIIQSKEARENFLEFIYDHHSELEKWQQYYQERFRVRIIEWLRNHHFDFVFEEDLELTKSMVEKLKMSFFDPQVSKDIIAARKMLGAKAKTYYSSEALNPRPKRGRPPKQVVKVETEPQFSEDIYTAVPKGVKPFLFVPDYHSSSAIFTFSGKFASEADLLAHRKQQLQGTLSNDLQNLQEKLAAIRNLSATWQIASNDLTSGKTPVGPPSLSTSVPIQYEQQLNGNEKSPSPLAKLGKSVSRGVSAKQPLMSKTAKKAKSKPLLKKRTTLKNTQKARFRSLTKKNVTFQEKKQTTEKKHTSQTLRKLRRAKKK